MSFSQDGLNTRALLSILRLEILGSKARSGARAMQASDIVSLKVSVSSTGMCLWSGEREKVGWH